MKDGELDKANYRRYKVKGVAGQDDFAMLHEVITRRLRRAVAENAFPDLLVIDGGKGQLNAALAAAHDLGIAARPVPGNEGVPFVELVGLAKSRLVDLGTRRVVSGRRGRAGPGRELADAADVAQRGFVAERERTPERVFLANRKDPIVLRQNSAELFLLTRLRDEAHRFAITFHRKLRRSRNFQSVLEEIPGIGAGRRRTLLRSLGSLRHIKEASVEELAGIEGFGAKAAQAVWDFFHPPPGVAVPIDDGAGMPGDPDEGAPGEAGASAPADVSEAEIDSALAEEGPQASAPESPRPPATTGYPGVAVPGAEHDGVAGRRSDGTA
jgi:excinuclease ABC subunit C